MSDILHMPPWLYRECLCTVQRLWKVARTADLCCRVSEESSREGGDEASSTDTGSLQRQLDRAREKLAARDASARKYKVHRRHP